MVSVTVRRKGGIMAKMARAEKRLDRAVDTSAHELANTAKELIESPPKTGRVYGAEQEVSFLGTVRIKDGVMKAPRATFTAYKGKKGHQASAPGEAPATETGALANSIGVEPAGHLARDVAARIEYAVPLEFGADDMEARPFMTPSKESVRPKFRERCEAAFADSFK